MPDSPTTQTATQCLESFKSEGFTPSVITQLKETLCKLDTIISEGYHQEQDFYGVTPANKQRYDTAKEIKDRLQEALARKVSIDILYLSTVHKTALRSRAMQDLLKIINGFLEIELPEITHNA